MRRAAHARPVTPPRSAAPRRPKRHRNYPAARLAARAPRAADVLPMCCRCAAGALPMRSAVGCCVHPPYADIFKGSKLTLVTGHKSTTFRMADDDLPNIQARAWGAWGARGGTVWLQRART
eukprot:5654811-Prymnesium_polylepis.1